MESDRQQSRTDRRFYIILLGNLVTIAFGVPAFWAYVNAYRLTGKVAPMPWWGWPAAAVAGAAALYTTATIQGIIHEPPKSDEEIIDEVVRDE